MKRWMFLSLLAIFGIAGFSLAQPAPSHDYPMTPMAAGYLYAMDDDDSPNAPEADSEFDDEFPPGPGRQFEQFRMNKMIEMLQLDDQQQQHVRQLFREHRREMRQIEMQTRRTLEELTRLLREPRADERAIDKTLSELDTLEIQRGKLHVEFKAKADKSLTIIQRAKLRVFFERFERQMVEKVRGMRQGMGGPHMRMPEPPPDDNDSE
jgi:Spy/CpxP family protein refolding chaperone